MDSSCQQPSPKQPVQRKARSLQEILDEFSPLADITYEPVKIEDRRKAHTLLPPTFTEHSHPYDYFALFFTPDLFNLITKNTNEYAAIHRINVEEGQREWTDLLVEELYVFIGAIIYMGVHEEPEVSMYWNTDFNIGPIHSIPTHISLRRFQQIKRYCHISSKQSDKTNGLYLPNNKIWWYKVEPLASTLQASFQQYYSPLSEVSIDELMVRCFGRSLHTYKMPNKPITEGYKIYGIADHGYLYNFIWSSHEKGLQEIILQPNLTKTGCLVQTLVLSLPRRNLTIYMDNYFTSIPLFTELRACQYGAMGTTRPHKEFPSGLKELKERFSTKLEWNTLVAKVVDNTLCLAWQDNNIVLALSNIHTINRAEDFREKVRKRPAKTSTNGRIVRQIFADEPTKSLSIPCFIDDYNQYMGGVDLANQFRESYETHRPTLRTWWPLFYWLIDVASINAYRLYYLYMLQLEKKPLTHLQFRVQLYCKLLNYSITAKLRHLRVGLGGRRVFGPELQHLHYWERRQKQNNCAWCLYETRCKRVLGKGVNSKVKRPIFGCAFCKVPLCQEGHCWERFHSNDAN